jgi:membrane protease subunit HflC
MKIAFSAASMVIAIALLIVIGQSAYTVHEAEQVIITQLGKPVGDPVTEAGLHFKLPFVQHVNRIDRRFLEWDGRPTEMPTKEKTYIIVDTFARWRISNPLQFFLKLTDERSAQSRLDDILGSETRNAVARHELIELIRTTRDRKPAADIKPAGASEEVGQLKPIQKGRARVEQEIFQNAVGKLREFGIELLDIRFKRINYNPKVRERIFARMISERKQIAERYRSEGAGEAAKILGNKERDLKEIASTAYKTIQTIQGDADARATEIYAAVYNQSPEAAEFYRFIKSMEVYQHLGKDTTLVLSTGSDLFNFLNDINGKTAADEAVRGPAVQTREKRLLPNSPPSEAPARSQPQTPRQPGASH